MTKPTGRNLPISPFRRLVGDMMHFCKKVPGGTVERRMNLTPVVAARQACVRRPAWCVLFAKAMGMLAARNPDFRRAYMAFPWPRLHEHPRNVVSLSVERRLADEDVLVYAQIRGPENRSLADLDAIVRKFKDDPLEQIVSFQRAMRMSRVPWLFRRLLWWATLNIFGRRRAHNFGTFTISSTAAQGAGVLHITPFLTTTLHYGMFDKAGCLDVRLTFDHRVFDGGTAARGLAAMEDIFMNEILSELQAMRRASAA
jgi:hypothetical protein